MDVPAQSPTTYRNPLLIQAGTKNPPAVVAQRYPDRSSLCDCLRCAVTSFVRHHCDETHLLTWGCTWRYPRLDVSDTGSVVETTRQLSLVCRQLC